MESRSEHSLPEQQTWNAQYYTPQAPAQSAQTEAAATDTVHVSTTAPNLELCARVREQLQSLLENDGCVRPETATALYTHVAICSDCAREFEAMQRVVHMLESLPLAELPVDYSHFVMRRIHSGQNAELPVAAVQALGLCERVREKMQPLLDNDLGVRPELATQLYGHLAVCMDCAAEFSAMRRMIDLLETLPAAELPLDYSLEIMRRIQSNSFVAASPKDLTAPRPILAASSTVSGGVATHKTHNATVSRLSETVFGVMSAESRQSLTQRLIVSIALTGLFIYLLASDWGRQMLGVNMDVARQWLSQIGENLEQTFLFGKIIVSLSAAFASINSALGYAFGTLGSMATQTLAVEISLGLAAFLMINSRRRAIISRV